MSVAASPQPPTAGAAGGSSPQGGASTAAAAVAGSPSASPAGASGFAPPAPGDGCPLCGAPLQPEQEWCLRCGAAARTRLSASPNWKAPIVIVAVVATLSLGVLAAALVKLAGSEGGSTISATTTVATSPAATSPAATSPAATSPAATAPAATAPAATATTPGAVTPGATTTGAAAPGASTQPGSIGTSTSPTTPLLGGAKGKTIPKLSTAEVERINKILKSGGK